MPVTNLVKDIMTKRHIDIEDTDSLQEPMAPPIRERRSLGEQWLVSYFDFLKRNTEVEQGILEASIRLIQDALIQLPTELPVVNGCFEALGERMVIVHTHSINVAVLSMLLAQEHQLEEMELRQLAKAALIHDIGRLMVPYRLYQSKRLTPEDLNLVKEHSHIGGNFLANIGVEPWIWRVALLHHKKYHPEDPGVEADEKAVFHQIVKVADVFDALTSLKSYQSKAGVKKALEVIWLRKNIDFNPLLVNALIRVMNYRPA
jgi:HD-GYP domain-containing protein (c-di-GMP phosphodiesterase class II)